MKVLLWRCSCHRNEKKNPIQKSFFKYDANLTSVITMELILFSLRCSLSCADQGNEKVGHSKISFCSVTPGVETFSSDLLRAGWCNLTCGGGLVFVLLGVDTTTLGVEFENTCIVSGKWNVSRVIPRLYGLIYKTLRFFPLVIEQIVVVMMVGSQSRRFQIESYGCLKTPTMTVRAQLQLRWNTYLFFNSDIELWVESWWGGDRKHCFVNICSLAVL